MKRPSRALSNSPPDGSSPLTRLATGWPPSAPVRSERVVSLPTLFRIAALAMVVMALLALVVARQQRPSSELSVSPATTSYHLDPTTLRSATLRLYAAVTVVGAGGGVGSASGVASAGGPFIRARKT